MNRRHAFIIAVLTFTAYFPTLRTGFIWDDHVIIEANPTILRWSRQNLAHDFLSDNALGKGDHYYRPMQAITDRLDHTLWGFHPMGFHLTNLIFHIGNALLIYLLVCRLGYSPMVALMTGIFFGVHPIDVEEFIVVSGRCTQMVYFFTLATLLFALVPGALWAGLASVSYLCALLSKESSLLAPIYLILILLYRKEPKRRYWILIPLSLFSLIYLWSRQRIVPQSLGRIDPSFLTLFMIKVFPRLCIHYAALLIWPWNLHNHRLILHLSHAWPIYWPVFLALGIYLIRTENRIGLFCFLWFLLSFLPMVPSMATGGFMLDHWGYGVVFCIFLPLSIIVIRGWESRRLEIRRLAAVGSCTYIILLALLVHLNVALRGTDERIYRWALNFTTSNPIKYNLGIYLLQTGRPREALIYLESVRDIYPDDANLSLALRQAHAAIQNNQSRR